MRPRRRALGLRLSALLPATLILLALLAGCSRQRSAAELYSLHCARCHGADGAGVEPQTDFYPRLDLTRSELVARGARASLYRTIRQGYDAMPGFDHALEHLEIEALVDYTLDLGKTKGAGAAAEP